MRSKKYSPIKIGEIKKVLETASIKEAAKICNVSENTARLVKHDKYYGKAKPVSQFYEQKLCPITGFKL